jgi:signal transduction histidine kinase
VAALASQATTGEFHGYVEERVELAHRRYIRVFAAYYLDAGSWDGVQPVTERVAEISGDHLVLLNSRGIVVADSSRSLLGKDAERSWVGGPAPIVFDGVRIGSLHVNPLGRRAAEGAFVSAVNQSLLVAASLAGLVALLLTVGLSRRIVAPLQSLTAAALRVEQGDLTQRVPEGGKDEVGNLARAFNSMAGAMAHNEELRRHMVSDAAHELRTPLTNVRGYLEALRDGVLEPDPQTLDSIFEEARLLERLVDDLQELALAEAGQLRMKRQPVPIEEVAERSASSARPQFIARGLRLDTRIDGELPLVLADAERVGQVLRNLLNNAAAHTPEGGVVTVSVRRVESFVEVAVTDTGIGIAAKDLPLVFERFYRADRSRARATGGAGLGLTIAKNIVEAHGGTIKVESQSGQGASFTFTVPVYAR